MSLTEQELKLALKGYPVKTRNGYPVDRIKIIGNRLVGYTHSSSDYAFWNLNGVHIGNNKLNIHLDHTEARQIGFTPQPEFGDLILAGDEMTKKDYTYFIDWDNWGNPICVMHGDVGDYEGGGAFNTSIYTEWHWPTDSPYNLTRYRVFKNDEEIELSGEQEEKVKEVVEPSTEPGSGDIDYKECETHGEEPQPGEWYWISSYHIPCGRFDRIDGDNPDQYIMAGYYEGDGWAKDRMINKHYVLRKMAPDEIEQEIDRIRKEMGFVPGADIKSIETGGLLKLYDRQPINYYPETDEFFADGARIYKQGQFAELISPAQTDERNIAVFVKELWQKEKVARIWGLDFTDDIYQEGEYVVYPEDCSHLQITIIRINSFKKESFESFCHRHGECPKPDYVEDEHGIIRTVKQWSEDGWPDVSMIGEVGEWSPATKKEFKQQNKE